MNDMHDIDATLTVAHDIAKILEKHQIKPIIIGALALAAHKYIRATMDVDIGVNADVKELRQLAHDLKESGYKVELREPDLDDPLGGVIDVSGSFGLVQIISFANRFPAVIEDALAAAELSIGENSVLRITPLPHLVALKLYAGGFKSQSDIVELIKRNPTCDIQAIRELCEKYSLRGLDSLLKEVGIDIDG